MVKQSVEAHVGYTPWNPAANRRIAATVTVENAILTAAVSLFDAEGNRIGRREMKSTESCGEIMKAVALAIAIAIAPVEVPAQEAAPPEDHLPKSPAPPKQTTLAAAPDRRRVAPGTSGILYFSGLGSLGAVPAVTFGLELGLGIRFGYASLLLGARYDFPGEKSTVPGQIEARRLLGQAAACLHFKMLAGCAGVSAGAFWSAGSGLDDARKDVSPALSGWLRLAGDIPLVPTVALRLYADLAVPILRQRIRESGTETVFWESPPAGAVWGMAFIFTFFDGNRTPTTIQ